MTNRPCGASVFLDEIGELPPDLQPKLLRVLELRDVVPVGTTKPVQVDVKVIAATSRGRRHRRALRAIAYAAQQTNHVVVEVA